MWTIGTRTRSNSIRVGSGAGHSFMKSASGAAAARSAAVLAFLCAALSGAAFGPAWAGVPEFNAYLLPELTTASVGDTVEVTFEVDATAEHFNAYEVTLQWNPSLLEFLSVAEGSLFTGACGNRFFQPVGAGTDSTVTYSHVLLCSGVSVNGPGILSTWKFRALADGVSDLILASNPDRTFFDDGLFVWPSHPTFPRQVVFHDAVVSIGNLADVDPEQGTQASPGLRLGIFPNPVTSDSYLWYQFDDPTLRGSDAGSGQVSLEILDLAGRRLGRWQSSIDPSARSSADRLPLASGGVLGGIIESLPRGSYFLRARIGEDVSSVKFVVVGR